MDAGSGDFDRSDLVCFAQRRPAFARTHMPNMIRLALGFGEIAGCVLMLYPRTAARGAWLLLAVLVLAIVIHLLHGIYGIGNLVIYAAAAWVVAEER